MADLEDELYIFYPDNTTWKFEIPDGNETRANTLWEPGGKTSGNNNEAVLVNKLNPSQTIVHNNDIEILKSAFS